MNFPERETMGAMLTIFMEYSEGVTVLNLQENENLFYGQELKFGELMLKRAYRELERLEKQIEQMELTAGGVNLQTRYEQLSSEIDSFEIELRNYKSQVTGGNWSVS